MVREWVCVEGRDGRFLVVHIDRSRGLAGLTANGQGRMLIVQLDQVRPIGGGRGLYGSSGESA